MKELSEKEALYKVAAYCSSSEHCLSEVADKLDNWGVSPVVKESILQYLLKEKYIDENRYCRCFVSDKFRYNKWGKNKIAQALWQKKISKDVFNVWLNEIDEQEYIDVLKELIAAKKKSIKAKSDYELNGKLIRFALGRGFEMEMIKRCINCTDDEE